MSASVFEVFVPRGKWPTFAAFNAALARRGYPMRVVPGAGLAESDRLTQDSNWMLGTRVQLNGEEYVGHLEEMSTNSAAIDIEETNERLEECGSPFRATHDHDVLVTSFGANVAPQYLVPGVLMNVVMIKDFDGYGFDGEEMKFGREDYADWMFGWIAPYVQPKTEAVMSTGQSVAAEDDASASAVTPKSRWTFWRIALVLFVLALAAEFIDKNVYNFTGTGG